MKYLNDAYDHRRNEEDAGHFWNPCAFPERIQHVLTALMSVISVDIVNVSTKNPGVGEDAGVLGPVDKVRQPYLGGGQGEEC